MSVEHRLAALERSNRLLRVAVTTLTLVAIGTASIAMTAPSRDLDVSTLRARKLVVLDAEGHARIESFHALDGTFGLAINNANGDRRVRLFDSPSTGKGAVQCLYPDGAVGASVAAFAGGADVSLLAPDGSPTLAATWSAASGASSLQLAAPDTASRMVLRSRTAGDAGMFVIDRAGTLRLSLRAKADNDATFSQFDQAGRHRLIEGTRGEAEAFSRMFDADGTQRLEVATMEDGTTVVRSTEAVVETTGN